MECLLLSDPEESDCLFEDGGGGRRGTWGSGLHSGEGGVSGFDSSSRSRESSCTTTSPTSASSVSSGASSLTESSFSSSFSSVFSSSSSSSSLSSESPNPSCARALAMFLRCTLT